MTKNLSRKFLTSSALLLSIFLPPLAATEPAIGTVEIVAELAITPGNVTASRTGRVFATGHGIRRNPIQLFEIVGRDKVIPFPDPSWHIKPGSGPDVFNTAHGILIDSQDRLWVTDHGNWMPDGAAPMPPRLFAFDLATRRPVFRNEFPEEVAPRDGILQDLAVDAERGFVYLADCGPTPAIVILDLSKNTSRRFIGHPALQAEDIDLVVEGKKLVFPDGKGRFGPARIAVNPITLSYPMTAATLRGKSHTRQIVSYYTVQPIENLRDEFVKIGGTICETGASSHLSLTVNNTP
jgi:hypothetical protein